MADLTWQRWVLDADDDNLGDGGSVELARQGATVFVQTIRGQRQPRIEIKNLVTEAVAKRSLEKELAKLRQAGYVEDGVVSRPEPSADTRAIRAAARERLLGEGRRLFDEKLPEFVHEWKALGYSPCLTFLAQCKRTRLHPNQVAQSCLALAESTFGVGFARRTGDFDSEHGTTQLVPARWLAEQYVSPVCILVIVYSKLRGQCVNTDDADVPGLADELMPRLRQLAAE